MNGFSVPPRSPEAVAEKILHVARNRDQCRAMGEVAMKTASAFDWGKVVHSYVAVYEEACSAGRT